MKNCVVRTLSRNYSSPTYDLQEKLNDGWTVKMCTPLINSDGKTDCIEYILEKEEDK